MSGPNWLGLLKWSMAHSDGTAPSDASHMSDEDKAFLQRVMESIKNEPDRMAEIIKSCHEIIDQNILSSSIDLVDSYMDELDDMVDHIDLAQIYVKLGGLNCLFLILEATTTGVDENLKCHVSTVIGTLGQNNIKVQDELFSHGYIERLVAVYLTVDSPKLKTKILYAISCSIRNHPAAETLFALQHAQQVFGIAFQLRDTALMRKVLYLAGALLSSDYIGVSSPAQDALLVTLYPNVFESLHIDDIDLREQAYQVLVATLGLERGWLVLATGTLHGPLMESLARRQQVLPNPVGEDNKREAELLLEIQTRLTNRPTVVPPVSNNMAMIALPSP